MKTSEEAAAQIRSDYELRYGKPTHELVEAGRVRDFMLSLGEEEEWEPGEAVPALFLITLGRTRRPQPSQGGAVNAGERFEFKAPVYVGDTIIVSRRVVAVEERQGKRGRMFLARAEASFTNQKGVVVGSQHQNTLRWGW